MEDLGGKVAVVTGAASGIGWAVCRRLAAEGMKLVLADIEAPRLDERLEQLARDEVEAVGEVCDVADGDQVEALAQAALDAFGAVHLVHNNAGVGANGLMAALTTRDWEWVLGVNLWGVIHGVRVFLPLLQAQDEGHIVNTASVAGLFYPPTMGPYVASKAAVVAVSESLFDELRLAGSRVGVSVLCPSWVATGIARSHRNRPEALRNEGDDGPDGPEVEAADAFIQTGIPPEQVADAVLDAVLTRRFYILTHDNTTEAVRRRMQAIIDGVDPPSVLPA